MTTSQCPYGGNHQFSWQFAMAEYERGSQICRQIYKCRCGEEMTEDQPHTWEVIEYLYNPDGRLIGLDRRCQRCNFRETADA